MSRYLKNVSKEVIAKNLDDGTVREFRSLADFARFANVSYMHAAKVVSRNLKFKHYKTCAGWELCYKNEVVND